ncbi:transglycosylase SLT domain-containing protein [Taylorella equigenitalis]|uniref:transglycosylase SLT domain-containing protein n=1 Tax=Taylorella equigenitalis TaxID=29575 RepID=UPI0004033A4D|nr:transglycosylase SLT domain-containing protein [Taylorella equigenitalis]ASY30994.1 lytic transglycosylase [Taylorella equigenitalis]KOS59594.1 murein transglycosylase [Taylorella equigenitalis]WDU46186.1 transglycosylase SLT domain-containing protein [Taylorella equigenitalis]
MKFFKLLAICATVALSACATNEPNVSNSKSNTYIVDYDVRVSHLSVWDRITDGFGMPNLDGDPLVQKWVEYYTNRPEYIERMAERSSKYLYHIVEEVEAHNFPTELALLPFVESAFVSTAKSSAKAAGLWQFIPSTGRNYNLSQDFWTDHRLNPIHSTRAAMDYLGYLYDFQANDWHLALASYNWGEGAVARARIKNENAGLPGDYQSLNMPDETRNYVPKLLAIKEIISNPQKYDIRLPFIPNTPYFQKVDVAEDMDVQVVAKLAGMSLDEFKELNPATKQPVFLASRGDFILLPVDKIQTYEENLASYKGDLATWGGYDPREGETLQSIAQKLKISLAKLKKLNGLGFKQKNIARTLLIPTNINVENFKEDINLKGQLVSNKPILVKNEAKFASPVKAKFKGKTKLVSTTKVSKFKAQRAVFKTKSKLKKIRQVSYTVKNGETMTSIAKRHGTTVANLKKLNGGKSSLKSGQKIRVQ